MTAAASADHTASREGKTRGGGTSGTLPASMSRPAVAMAARVVDGAGDWQLGEARRRRRRNRGITPRSREVSRAGEGFCRRDYISHTATVVPREVDGGGCGLVPGARRRRGWNQETALRSPVFHTVAEGQWLARARVFRASATSRARESSWELVLLQNPRESEA